MQTTMVICYQPQQSQDGSRCVTLFATDYTLDYWLFVSLFVFFSFILLFLFVFFFLHDCRSVVVSHGGKTMECFSISWGYKSCSSHPTVLYVSLSVLTQLGPHCSGWMRGLRGWEQDGVGGLSYIPSIGAVCLPTRSLPVQSREIGREEFPLCCPCWTRAQPHRGLYALGAHVCMHV